VSGTNWHSLCGDASPTNPLYNTARAWNVESDDYNHTFGIGGRYDFGWARVELDYTYTTGVTKIGYDYNPNALGITNPDTLALIGSGMPNLNTTQQFADLNVIVPINKSVAVERCTVTRRARSTTGITTVCPRIRCRRRIPSIWTRVRRTTAPASWVSLYR
jgi:hypothetical protein